MPSEFPMNDPRYTWQNQPTEPFKMSADEMRGRAQQLQEKSRFAALTSIALGLVLCVLFALSVVIGDGLVPRMGWAVLSLWCLYFAYQAYKWTWPAHLAPDASVSTCLEFYGRELERKRDHGLHVWRRAGLTFCFLGLAMVVLPAMIKMQEAQRLPWNAVPFFALLFIWFALFFFMKKRNRRKLQQEIEELREFERAGR